MTLKLFVKFLITYLLFGLLGLITISTVAPGQIYNYLIKDKATILQQEAYYISNQYGVEYYSREMSLAEFQEKLEILNVYLEAPIWVISPTGVVFVNSEGTKGVVETQYLTIKEFDPALFGNSSYITGNFYNQFDEPVMTVISTITVGLNQSGYVLIHYPISLIQSTRDSIMDIIYRIYALIFLVSLILLGAFTRYYYLPLRKITQGANEYATGNFDYKINMKYQDHTEFDILKASLEYMANQLNTLEEYQKKFVANISHDFRSPLTSIKGYVEAIEDGTIPYEMQGKYLNIILFETDRLNKLTQSLLTLNDMNSKNAMLDIVSFDINKIIKQTAEAFEGICTPKKISIELILTGESQLVAADMGKIQQVLYNLIDNAIKFSHNNSVITVETTEKYEKIFVSVKDTGIGIPKDSLNKVWERFYKTDLSRGKDKKGTGLGLAIVKEIIQSHGENINVISTEGVGTEFIFTLPKKSLKKPNSI